MSVVCPEAVTGFVHIQENVSQMPKSNILQSVSNLSRKIMFHKKSASLVFTSNNCTSVFL